MKIIFQGHTFDNANAIITGSDLKMMRVMANKTHSTVAETIGVKSRKTIENWEKSSSQPKIEQFILLAQYFGFDAAKVVDACLERAMAGDPELDHHSINWSACRL